MQICAKVSIGLLQKYISETYLRRTARFWPHVVQANSYIGYFGDIFGRKETTFGIGLFVGKGFKNPARYSLYCFLTHVSCQNLPKPIFPRNVTFNRARTNARSVWWLKLLSETIIAEKQLGCWVGRSTKERFLKSEYYVRGISRIGQSMAWSPLAYYLAW